MVRVVTTTAIAVVALASSCTGLASASSWFEEVRSTFLGNPIGAQKVILPILDLAGKDTALLQHKDLETTHQTPRTSGVTRRSETIRGVFSPVIQVAKTVMGGGLLLNKVRVKLIGLKTDRLTEASESPTLQAGLQRFFQNADSDQNGVICERELTSTVRSLGFWWLGDNQMRGLFDRADKDRNGSISFEEFVQETPRALLVKLAR